MHMPSGRKPRADIDELPDARLRGKKPDGTGKEMPVRPGRSPSIRHHDKQAISDPPVLLVIVLAAEQVIVGAGDWGGAGAATGHQPAYPVRTGRPQGNGCGTRPRACIRLRLPRRLR